METTDPSLYNTIFSTGDVIEVQFKTATNTAGVCSTCDLSNPNNRNNNKINKKINKIKRNERKKENKQQTFVCDGGVVAKEWLDSYFDFVPEIGLDYEGR